MDHINRIELQGRVGTVRTNIIGDNMVANFSLVTEYLYKTRDGEPPTKPRGIRSRLGKARTCLI